MTATIDDTTTAHAAEPAGGTLRAGVVGLGMIGGGVATSLARSGRTPLVYDVRPEAATGLPAQPAATPAAVAAGSDVVLVAVVDAAQVRAVLRGDDGVLAGARPGLIVVVLSTVSVPEVAELATECGHHGVTVLDCGVTPGDRAATNGMVAMLGGDADTVRRARPVLEDFAKQVVHCGPLGAGMATKIARNVITYGSWRAVQEAADLAAAAGVDPQTLIDVVGEADPDGATLFTWLRNRAGRPDHVAEVAPQVQRLMDKDLAAAQDFAAGHGLAVPLVDATRERGADTLGLPGRRPPADRGDDPGHDSGRDSGRDSGHDPGRDPGHDRGERGLRTMDEVYGPGLAAAMPAERGPALSMTIDHLFGEVWSRPGLSIRDRRLLVLGATAMLGRADLIETQVRGALINEELSEAELDEIVLQLHYYAGWGNGTAVQRGVDAALANRAQTFVAPDDRPDPA
ncbi:NAD(P)-binding domain-containing protein [Mycolicibacterium palauense]|uniref:NAD(P)-binding domain-containing protein n=1 Tax=Mycolicibacterium palauense TaxID=2034511 RepID=UPI000BFEDE90|nr:NAD(P)-binding domain-containing protein [Mycolicibacterium palauense]